MGTLTYHPAMPAFEFDDVTLAHLEAVVVAKLRRRESFMLTFLTDAGRVGVWVHEASNLRYAYPETKPTEFDRARLEEMVKATNHASGLVIADVTLHEPDATPDPEPQPAP